MRLIPSILGLLTLAAVVPQAIPANQTAASSSPAEPAAAPVPAGAYTLDKAHASLIFRVDHLGFSNFTARFSRFDARLQFDPANPASSSVTVTIDPRSIESDNPPAGFMDLLRGGQWLNTAKYPQMTFRSTRVERSGPNALRIQGDLSLHGVTRPVTLNATYNGGYAGHPMDPHARIGFSARGSLERSQFGIALGVPSPGSTMGVGDRVEIIVEAEFTGPPLAGAAAAQK